MLWTLFLRQGSDLCLLPTQTCAALHEQHQQLYMHSITVISQQPFFSVGLSRGADADNMSHA